MLVEAHRPVWVQLHLCPCHQAGGGVSARPEHWLLRAASTRPFLSLSFPQATYQAPWRSGLLPALVISVLLFFLPGDQDLPQVCPYRAPPRHSLAVSSTGYPLGRSESLEKSQSLCRGVGCSVGLGAGGCLLGVGVPLLFSLALCSGLNKNRVVFWPGAHLRDGPSLAGLWFSLAVEVLFTAFCPQRATVFGGAEDFLFLPQRGLLTMPTPGKDIQGVSHGCVLGELSSGCPACHCLSPHALASRLWAPNA